MTLPDPIRDVADRWWARDFGCPPTALRPASTHVQQHAGELLGYPGVWVLSVDEAPLVSMPAGLFEAAGERARSWSRAHMFEPERMVATLRPHVVHDVLGPAFIGYLVHPPSTAARGAARLLTAADAAAVERLRAACEPLAWSHGGSELGEVPTFGAFAEDGELAALAGYETWVPSIAHIAVVSHPAYRGRGFGRAAVMVASAHAMGAGLVAQYRTLASNTPSMRIAQQLGFQTYGFSVALKLEPPEHARHAPTT